MTHPSLPFSRFLLPVAVAWLVACSEPPPPEPDPTLNIGVLVNLGGTIGETSGEPTVQGAELAAAEVNQVGGVVVGGRAHRVELTVVDFEDRSDAATTAARSILNQPRIHALVGPQFSRHAIPVSNLAEAAQVPMISPMSTSPETTRGKRWVYRVAFPDDFQSLVLARFARESLNAVRAAVLYERSSAYSAGLAEMFRDQYTELGGQVVAEEAFTAGGEVDFRPLLERVLAARPQVLFLPNETSWVETQIPLARAVGWEGPILGSDTWDVDRVAELPESEGAYVVDLWHPDLESPQAREFRERYESRYGVPPKTSAATAYDAVGLLVQALEGADTLSTETIRGGLSQLRAFEGATGRIRYVGTGDPERSALIVRLTGGRDQVHQVVEPRD